VSPALLKLKKTVLRRTKTRKNLEKEELPRKVPSLKNDDFFLICCLNRKIDGSGFPV
jgi:hypothetical protein